MALNKTAFSKRAEQLKRYEDSETNRESVVPKNPNERKVRFSAGCIFLAACAAGDKDEVLNMLNSGGADIDTANVDGLTALHQACIEDNLDMVEFLVTHGANVNRKDNEGWTPLHATSSCGIVSIARYLIENGADLASVNSDGELPIDIAGTNAMADLLQHYIDEQGIDCDEARQQEEKLMLSDAKKWLRSDASEADRPHPKTGATALHVAAAKGYTKVLSLLLAGRADVDRQDNDGWTPLHAACYWGKKEAAQMLIASMADMDILNYSNQTCIEIAPKEMIPWLEELRKNNKRTKRRPVSQIRISDNNIDNNIESPPKVIRVELKSPAEQQTTNEEQKQTNKMTTAKDQMQLPLTKENDSMDDIKQKQDNPTQVPVKENQTNNDSEVILRRTQSFENDEKFYQKYIELRARIKANSCPALPATQITIAKDDSNKESVTKSSTNFIIQRSASLKDHRSQLSNRKIDEKTPPTSPTTPTTPASTPSGHLRRSFVPPTRDEESETQRKAHAKRVRETRRSTQGVTLDEIKSAEQLVKMKNASNSNGNFKLEDTSQSSTSTGNSTQQPQTNSTNGIDLSKVTTNTPVVSTRRQNSSENSVPNDTSSAVTKETPVTPNRSDDDKENDKENDSRSGLAIHRRRRPKRRSTGVVHVDMEEIDPEYRQESPVEDNNKDTSGNESRSCAESLASNSLNTNDDGEFIDYKALYEAAKTENELLRASLKSREQDLAAAKLALERLTAAATKSSLSENEKREKRAMERKISEMEEELKQMDALKTENQRLKDENGALIRVISKLSK